MAFIVDHTIPRRPEEVWRIMTDWKIAEYWLGVNRLRPVNAEQAPKGGTQLTYLVRGTPQPMEVTTWQPPEQLGLSSRQGGIVISYQYELTAVESGTRVQLVSACQGRTWFWRALAPILEWTMRVADRRQLTALDQLVRATTGSGN